MLSQCERCGKIFNPWNEGDPGFSGKGNLTLARPALCGVHWTEANRRKRVSSAFYPWSSERADRYRWGADDTQRIET